MLFVYCFLLIVIVHVMKQQIMHQKSGSSNHGSLVFLRFGNLMNSPSHNLKSLDHFLLTVKDKNYVVWTNTTFITLQVRRCNVLAMGNNKTSNPPYNVMAVEPILRPVQINDALHFVCLFRLLE